MITKENNQLIIKLPTILDRNNSKDVFSRIIQNLNDDIQNIVFDAQDLRYISADGLDVILESKKKCSDIIIDHARIGICDILESYGFNHFLNINKQYRFISIEGCKIIGQGGHGTIYQIAEDTIVKVYRDHSALEVIENERQFARNAFICGIPTAIAYDIVQTEQGYGVIFEMINGMTLGQYLSKHPDKVEEYSIKFADLLHTLHTTEASSELYPDFHDVYLQRAENAKKYISKEDGEILKQIIQCIPRGCGMVHGDYHPNNVMIDDEGELLLIDMADISRGNGFFDMGGTYLVMNFITKIPLLRNIVKNITAIDYQTCEKMWDIIMKRYYNTDDENILENYEKQFKAFSNIRIACQIGMQSSRPKIVTKLIALYTHRIIIPKANHYIEIFKTISK